MTDLKQSGAKPYERLNYSLPHGRQRPWADVNPIALDDVRFLAGLSIEATAKLPAISPTTVKRDWIVARGWLSRELSRGGGRDA